MPAPSDSIPTRRSLLDRLKAFDDNESWKQFFDTYWALIYTMALRSGLTDSEAQDVVQETLICVAKSMPDFDYDPKIGSFKAWLRKLTRWRIVDHIRKRNATPTPIGDLRGEGPINFEEVDESDASFEASWETEWRKAVIDAAATRTKARVDEKHFQIFDCVSLKGWSSERVSSALKIARPRVYVINHRVRKVFEQELKSIDIETYL